MDNKLSAPLSTLQWVNRDSLKPNDYNPNKVSKQNLELHRVIPQMDSCRNGTVMF